jgi:hypothetical protein
MTIMQQENKRKFWQMPWGYPESIVITAGIALVGFVLQITIKEFNFYLLTSPVNLIVGALIVGFCLLTLPFRKSKFIRWFTSVPFSVCLIMALLLLTLIMGLTPQTGTVTADRNFFTMLGFHNMTGSWPFILIYFTTLLSLGSLIVRRLAKFNIKDYGFYLNHLGLWLVLFAGGLGHADMGRYIMHVREGEVEWRVYDDEGTVKELPIAIQLNDFDMEEYPPKLTIIDRTTGEPQPLSAPDYYQIDTKAPTGKLDGWELEMNEYIHQAVRNSDSTYREMPMPGSTPAAHITMTNPSTGETLTGWVCGGNWAQLYKSLELSEKYTVVMTVAEPKRFTSDIEVYTPDGTTKSAILEVNHPLRIKGWTIYQYGYDNAAGRLSSYSSMELVYDPWIVPVYIGFVMIAIGAIAMIVRGRSPNRKTLLTYNQREE